jgi:hypothetical protein
MDTHQRNVAASAYSYAMALCIRNTRGAEYAALVAADQQPTIENVRAVLAVARGKPWEPLFESTLVECGLAAFDDVLKGR